MKRPEEGLRSLALLIDLVNDYQGVPPKDQIHKVYNFAAHCYMMLGDHVTAITMLQESLWITPDLNTTTLMIP